jgi:hypothetical protein
MSDDERETMPCPKCGVQHPLPRYVAKVDYRPPYAERWDVLCGCGQWLRAHIEYQWITPFGWYFLPIPARHARDPEGDMGRRQ